MNLFRRNFAIFKNKLFSLTLSFSHTLSISLSLALDSAVSVKQFVCWALLLWCTWWIWRRLLLCCLNCRWCWNARCDERSTAFDFRCWNVSPYVSVWLWVCQDIFVSLRRCISDGIKFYLLRVFLQLFFRSFQIELKFSGFVLVAAAAAVRANLFVCFYLFLHFFLCCEFVCRGRCVFSFEMIKPVKLWRFSVDFYVEFCFFMSFVFVSLYFNFIYQYLIVITAVKPDSILFFSLSLFCSLLFALLCFALFLSLLFVFLFSIEKEIKKPNQQQCAMRCWCTVCR